MNPEYNWRVEENRKVWNWLISEFPKPRDLPHVIALFNTWLRIKQQDSGL